MVNKVKHPFKNATHLKKNTQKKMIVNMIYKWLKK